MLAHPLFISRETDPSREAGCSWVEVGTGSRVRSGPEAKSPEGILSLPALLGCFRSVCAEAGCRLQLQELGAPEGTVPGGQDPKGSRPPQKPRLGKE